MANWQKGLESLSTGLNSLVNHAIYKEESARKAKLDEAQQRMNERLMNLREEAQQKGFEFEERQLDFQEGRAQTEDERFEQSMDLDRKRLDIDQSQAEESSEHRAWQRQQAEEQMSRESEQAEMERYNEVIEKNRERAQELNDKVYEVQSDVTMSEEERANVIKQVEQERQGLLAEDYRMQWKAGRISEEDFTPMQVSVLETIQNNENIDRGAATAALMEMRVPEFMEFAKEAGFGEEEVRREMGMERGDQSETPPPPSGESPDRGGGDNLLTAVGKDIGKFASDPIGDTMRGLTMAEWWVRRGTDTVLIEPVKRIFGDVSEGFQQTYTGGQDDAPEFVSTGGGGGF